MIWTGVPCYTKYKSSLGHKAIYNYIIFYLIALNMTGLEVLKDLENE